MPKSVFDILSDAKINFAVGVSIRTFKFNFIDDVSRDYFVFINKTDQKKLKEYAKQNNITFWRLGFYSESNKNIIEHDLTADEIVEFKQNLNLYQKVKHTSNGRIYERIASPFKLNKASKKRKIKLQK